MTLDLKQINNQIESGGRDSRLIQARKQIVNQRYQREEVKEEEQINGAFLISSYQELVEEDLQEFFAECQNYQQRVAAQALFDLILTSLESPGSLPPECKHIVVEDSTVIYAAGKESYRFMSRCKAMNVDQKLRVNIVLV